MTQSNTTAPEASLLEQVRQDLRAEADQIGTDLADASAADLGVPSRVMFGEAVNELIDEILMSTDASPAALRNKVADQVDSIMRHRRHRSGYIERLLRASRIEQHRTVADVATNVGVDESVIADLEDGVRELRAEKPDVIALWIHQLERLNSDVEAALWRSAGTTAMPQADLVMAGEGDRLPLAATEAFVTDVMGHLRGLEKRDDRPSP